MKLSQPHLWSLRTQARTLVCSLLAVVAVATGWGWGQRSATQLQEEAGVELLQTARAMADRLSHEMAGRAHDVKLLSQLDVLRNLEDPIAARTALERLQGTMPAYAWIGMTDAEGTIAAATGDVLQGKSIAARPVFQNGRKGLWTGDVHEAVLLAQLAPHKPGEAVKFVDVAAPVQSADGEFRGVLALHLSWQWADALRNSILKPRGGDERVQLSVIGRDGLMLLAPTNAAAATALPLTRLKALEEKWSAERWSDGVESLTGVAESRAQDDFAGFGWRVVAREPAGATQKNMTLARRTAMAWSIGIGALCAAFAWWVIGLIVAPVEKLAQALEEHDDIPPRDRTVRPTQRRNDVQQIAVAVSRLQQAIKDRDQAFQSLELKANSDPLTGLWNRQYLADLGERLMPELAERQAELCVLCLDLDGFKPINDKYGHDAGDQVLVQIAARLKKAAREEDFVFRMGGDKFMLLLVCPPNEGSELARTVAARLLADIRRPMNYRTLSNLRVDCSIGAAIWPVHGITLNEVMQRADEALYLAKRSGRGQVRQYVRSVDHPAAA
jgi:diguanylate cyclase (GGDEF)-like protein